jgi:uncharacterized protein YaiI (UPF0178 family)
MVALVANRGLYIPSSPWIRTLQVERGFDVADREIVGRVTTGDLVVTQDIQLAAAILAIGAQAVTPYGVSFSTETIGECLALRELIDELRTSGIDTGGPGALGSAERQALARQLDTYLGGRDTRS